MTSLADQPRPSGGAAVGSHLAPRPRTRRTRVRHVLRYVGPPEMILVAFAALAVVGSSVAPHDPLELHSALANRAPLQIPGFLLGTDQLGRDLLSRLIVGARLSFILSIVPVVGGGIIGVVLGAVAGLGPRTVGTVLMRFTDVLLAFPSIVLALAVVAVRGPSFGNALLALTVVFVAPMTRVARGVAVEVASRPYIEAARLSGAGTTRIIRDFGLPNMLPPILIYAASQCGVMLLYGAGLSFLGAGAQPPDIEWGRMVADGRVVFLIDAWPSLLPGILIFVVSLAFNLLGDRLRDRLDPRWRRT